MARLFLLLVILMLPACALLEAARSPAAPAPSKLSIMLQQQVELRQRQLAAPSEGNLQSMRDLGMIIDDIGVQRVYIYLEEPLADLQVQDLEGLGVKLHPDSWIPPLGDNPYGFLIAGVPVNEVTTLAGRGYVVRLDTAERQGLPTCEILPRP